MGFLEVLTIIFIILKVFGVISWSWWIVFLPTIFTGTVYITSFLIAVLFSRKAYKKIQKEFDDDLFR